MIRLVLLTLFGCRHPLRHLRVDGIWNTDILPAPMASVTCMRCKQSH